MSSTNDPNDNPPLPTSDDPYVPSQPQLAAPQLPPPLLTPMPMPMPVAGAGAVYATPATTNVWAIISLVASILGWLGLFGIGGIIGVVTGVIARNEIAASRGAQSGDGLALTGIILGALNIVGGCLIALCVFTFFASFPLMFGGFGSGR